MATSRNQMDPVLPACGRASQRTRVLAERRILHVRRFTEPTWRSGIQDSANCGKYGDLRPDRPELIWFDNGEGNSVVRFPMAFRCRGPRHFIDARMAPRIAAKTRPCRIKAVAARPPTQPTGAARTQPDLRIQY